MNKRSLLSIAASIILASAPLLVEAAQISPNPNPAGSTLDIINDPFAFNNENPYSNGGTITIDSSSTLTNSVGARLNNYDLATGVGGILNNAGTLNNAGALWNSQRDSNGTLNNVGTLSNFAGASISGIRGSVTNAVGGTVNNYGSLSTLEGQITNAGTLSNFAGASISLNSGRLTNEAGGTVNNYGGLGANYSPITNAGTLNNFAGASMRVESTFMNAEGSTLNNSGTIVTDYVGGVQNYGTYNNVGSVHGYVSNLAGATLNNSGLISLAGGLGGGLGNAGTLINTGTVSSPGYGGNLGNSGTLVNAGSILLGTKAYTQSAGQTINTGTMTASLVDIQGGSLRGTGTINGPVTLASGAVLSPGTTSNFGTLTLNGNLQSSGNLMFRIGGLGAGQFDVLAIHGMAFLNGGTIGFNFMNFTPVAGNSWDFLYADAISGWETLRFNIGGLSSDLRYTFSYANGVQTLRVVSVPEPDSFVLLVIALGSLVWWRRLNRA